MYQQLGKPSLFITMTTDCESDRVIEERRGRDGLCEKSGSSDICIHSQIAFLCVVYQYNQGTRAPG
jgi:hypothetical protein